MWEIGFGVGAVILLAALVYGVIQSSRRKRTNDPVTREATRELYKRPDEYADHEEKELRNRLK